MTLLKDPAALIVGPSQGPVVIDPKYTVIIGTSGSTEYLRDTDKRRLWPVSATKLRGDLTELLNDEYGEARRDEDKEME